jgi:hypothetical protein
MNEPTTPCTGKSAVPTSTRAPGIFTRLPPHLFRRLEALAEAEGLSAQNVIRRLIAKAPLPARALRKS